MTAVPAPFDKPTEGRQPIRSVEFHREGCMWRYGMVGEAKDRETTGRFFSEERTEGGHKRSKQMVVAQDNGIGLPRGVRPEDGGDEPLELAPVQIGNYGLVVMPWADFHAKMRRQGADALFAAGRDVAAVFRKDNEPLGPSRIAGCKQPLYSRRRFIVFPHAWRVLPQRHYQGTMESPVAEAKAGNRHVVDVVESRIDKGSEAYPREDTCPMVAANPGNNFPGAFLRARAVRFRQKIEADIALCLECGGGGSEACHDAISVGINSGDFPSGHKEA